MKVYVASSWRNEFYQEVVDAIREAGHQVYDFRDPSSEGSLAVIGAETATPATEAHSEPFKWSLIGEDWLEWSPEQYREHLEHPLAKKQFANDIAAMEACDACVIVLPCGRSAHTEAGWFAGKGRKVFAYIPEKQEPELMYKLFDGVACSIYGLVSMLDF